MSCPHARHGSPTTCSQCLGATARVVRRDPEIGLLIDGQPAGRGFDTDAAPAPARKRRGLTVSKRRPRGA